MVNDNNPKTRIGATKVPLHLVPPSATHYLALALADGAKKYGPYNWRSEPISVSVYKAAAQRHWDAYWDGEDNAKDSGVHHLAHAMACAALLLDAASIGKLVDDRPPKGASAELQENYNKVKEDTKVDTTKHAVPGAWYGPTPTSRSPEYQALLDALRAIQDPVEFRGVPNVQENVRTPPRLCDCDRFTCCMFCR